MSSNWSTMITLIMRLHTKTAAYSSCIHLPRSAVTDWFHWRTQPYVTYNIKINSLTQELQKQEYGFSDYDHMTVHADTNSISLKQ